MGNHLHVLARLLRPLPCHQRCVTPANAACGCSSCFPQLTLLDLVQTERCCALARLLGGHPMGDEGEASGSAHQSPAAAGGGRAWQPTCRAATPAADRDACSPGSGETDGSHDPCGSGHHPRQCAAVGGTRALARPCALHRRPNHRCHACGSTSTYAIGVGVTEESRFTDRRRTGSTAACRCRARRYRSDPDWPGAAPTPGRGRNRHRELC